MKATATTRAAAEPARRRRRTTTASARATTRRAAPPRRPATLHALTQPAPPPNADPLGARRGRQLLHRRVLGGRLHVPVVGVDLQRRRPGREHPGPLRDERGVDGRAGHGSHLRSRLSSTVARRRRLRRPPRRRPATLRTHWRRSRRDTCRYGFIEPRSVGYSRRVIRFYCEIVTHRQGPLSRVPDHTHTSGGHSRSSSGLLSSLSHARARLLLSAGACQPRMGALMRGCRCCGRSSSPR